MRSFVVIHVPFNFHALLATDIYDVYNVGSRLFLTEMREGLGPNLTQSRLGRDRAPYKVTS